MIKVEVTGWGAKVVTEMVMVPRSLLFYGILGGELATIPLLCYAVASGPTSVSATTWLDRAGLYYHVPLAILILLLWYGILRVDVSPSPRSNLHASYSWWCAGVLIGIFAVTYITSTAMGAQSPVSVAIAHAFFWTGIPFVIYFVAEGAAEIIRRRREPQGFDEQTSY